MPNNKKSRGKKQLKAAVAQEVKKDVKKETRKKNRVHMSEHQHPNKQQAKSHAGEVVVAPAKEDGWWDQLLGAGKNMARKGLKWLAEMDANIAEEQDVLVKFDETVCVINGTGGSTFTNQNFSLNPGDPQTFPQLSQQTIPYMKYDWIELDAYYTPLISNYQSTGELCISGMMDPTLPQPSTLQEAEGGDVHDFGMPDKSMRLPIARRQFPKIGMFIRRFGNIGQGAYAAGSRDIRLCDVGQLNLSQYGTPDVAVGTLRIRGVVKLYSRMVVPVGILPIYNVQIVQFQSVAVTSGTNVQLSYVDIAQEDSSLISVNNRTFNNPGNLVGLQNSQTLQFLNTGMYRLDVMLSAVSTGSWTANAIHSIYVQKNSAGSQRYTQGSPSATAVTTMGWNFSCYVYGEAGDTIQILAYLLGSGAISCAQNTSDALQSVAVVLLS